MTETDESCSRAASVESGEPPRAHPHAGVVQRLFPWGLGLLLVAPSILWVMTDRSVWSWDPASYATESVDLWFKLANEPSQWLRRMRTVFPSKAPGTAWLGQFFVPIGRWMGSVEVGLLASVLLVQVGTLVMTFRFGRRVAPRSVLPSVVGTVFVAASPVFVAMSHHFMTEGLQLFSIAYLVWVAVESRFGPPILMLLHLALAVSIGVIAKFATPAFVFFPACVAAVRVLRGILRPSAKLTFRGREMALALVLVVVVALGLAWYLRNGRQVYAFAKLASTGDVALDYGSRGTALTKLLYWIPAMGRTLVVSESAWLFVVGIPAAVWVWLRRVRDGSGKGHGQGTGALVFAALAQFGFVLFVLAKTINQDPRYVIGLAPTLALVLMWLVAELRSRWALALVLLVLAVQWGLVHARQLGLAAANGATYWEKAPSWETSTMREIAEVEREVCRKEDGGRPIMTGIDLIWLNYCTLTFYSSKAQLDRGFRCGYEYLGHAQKDFEAGFAKLREIQAPYFVSLEEGAMPQPPDFLNEAALAVLRRVESDPRFVRVPFESKSRFAVFRHVGQWDR